MITADPYRINVTASLDIKYFIEAVRDIDYEDNS